MKESFQVVFGKSDGEESWTITRSLELPQMQYLVTNGDYDYDIYICDIERFKLRHIESLIAGP